MCCEPIRFQLLPIPYAIFAVFIRLCHCSTIFFHLGSIKCIVMVRYRYVVAFITYFIHAIKAHYLRHTVWQQQDGLSRRSILFAFLSFVFNVSILHAKKLYEPGGFEKWGDQVITTVSIYIRSNCKWNLIVSIVPKWLFSCFVGAVAVVVLEYQLLYIAVDHNVSVSPWLLCGRIDNLIC